MAKKKLIDLYYEWMESGEIPDYGLCHSVPEKYENTLGLFEPTYEDELEIVNAGLSLLFWGAGELGDLPTRACGFTKLRQTIVLFICAMHNEI